MQTEKGQSIEDKSMQIIESEVGTHQYNELEWPIVRRVIHATADFDFANKNKIIFHKNAIENGITALKKGCNIVVDVNGVIGGFNKANLKEFSNNVICNIGHPDVVEEAKKLQKTRDCGFWRPCSSSTKMTPPPPVVPAGCRYKGRQYRSGDSWLDDFNPCLRLACRVSRSIDKPRIPIDLLLLTLYFNSVYEWFFQSCHTQIL